MSEARVEDLEVFRVFRAALLKFVEASNQALAGADSHIARTRGWLENEQRRYWEMQCRKRANAVAQAQDAVRQKKLFADGSGHKRDASEEEKHLKRCIAALEEANTKLENVRKYLPRLERANDLYRGGVARLIGSLSGDLPKAVALLDRLAAQLAAYTRIDAPLSPAPPADDGSIAQPEDAAPPPPPADVPQSPTQEPSDVPHRQ